MCLSRLTDSEYHPSHTNPRVLTNATLDGRLAPTLTYDAPAKQLHREREAQTRLSSDAVNKFNKRPLEITPATSTSPTAPNTRSYPSSSSTRTSLRNATTSVGPLQALTMGDASGVGPATAATGPSDDKGKGKTRLGRDGFPIEDDPNKVRETLR